jgi:hypothetical protein
MPALNDLVAEVAASATAEDPEAQVPHKRVRGVGCLGPTYVTLPTGGCFVSIRRRPFHLNCLQRWRKWRERATRSEGLTGGGSFV